MLKISLFAGAAATILIGVGAWAASTTYAPVDAPVGTRVDPSEITKNAENLPTNEFVDYTFVFH